MYQNFIIPYLYEAQHASGDTPPIIRSLKLHWQPLVFHKWKVVGRVVGGRCQAQCARSNNLLPVSQQGSVIGILYSENSLLCRPKSCRFLGVITQYHRTRSFSFRLLPYATLSLFSVAYLHGNLRKFLVYFGEKDSWTCPSIRHSVSHRESSPALLQRN